MIHSDNGKQFVSQEFQRMIQAYKIKHMKTAVYAPQSNASERANQSVLAGIRAYLEGDHRDWDTHLSEIECSLRSSMHEAIGTSPYFALFGQQMYNSGPDYELARKLQALGDAEIDILTRKDNLQLIRQSIKDNLHKAYE
mgnify:FL=1